MEMEVVDYIEASDQARIFFNKARIDQRSLIISKQNYHDRKKDQTEKIEAVIHYTRSEVSCRSKLLLSYFGEKESKDCGHCDLCLERKKKEHAQEHFGI